MHLIKRLSWLGQSANAKADLQQSKMVRKMGKKGRRSGYLDMPAGIALTVQGELVIADTHNHRVQVFTPEGALKRKFGEQGLGPEHFCYPKGVAVSPSPKTPEDQRIMVTDSANSAIKIFDITGTLQRVIEHPGELTMPYGICVTKDGGYIITTDIFKHKVIVFHFHSGEISHGFGSYGNETNMQFDHPYHVTTNANKQIIVSDYGNAAIKIFHFEGRLLRHFNSNDFKLPADDFIHLGGLTVDADDNTIVICNSEVYILTKNGRLWQVITENDGLSVPLNVAVSNVGFLYVTNGGPNVSDVTVFRYNRHDYRSLNTLAYYAIDI